MLSLYEILKASKTGIAPNMWTALAGMNWGGADSGHEVKELTGIPPLSFRSNGTMLLDYLISGNMSQTGTPTPDSPIMPQGTGERTGNLFDGSIEQGTLNENTAIGTSYNNMKSAPTAVINPYRVRVTNPIYIDRELTVSIDFNSYQMYVLFFDENQKYTGSHSSSWRNTPLTLSGEYIGKYIGLIVKSKQSGNVPISPTDDVKLMLNEGSTAPPYEPYGYKIPISSGGENLFIQKLTGVTIASSGQIVSDANYDTYIAEVSNGETYTVSNVADTQVFGFFTTKPALGAITYNSSRTIFSTSSQTLTVPTGGNIKYIGVRYNTGVSNAMLNLGSEPLPYSPYNRTTTPIYLGEVPTTRKIKKSVLTGEEAISVDLGYNRFFFSIMDMRGEGARLTKLYCTHYQNISDGRPIGSVPDNSIYAGGGVDIQKVFIKTTEYTTVADFKSYLAQQYAAGTPVTIWYVLATEETGIINEPLRKIGYYADTLSMEQAGVQIPTNKGNTVIDVETTLKPSEMHIKYQE